MDYIYMEKDIYSQVLWQVVLRAQELNLKFIDLGISAPLNKRKFGADAIQQMAFVQIQDNYNMSVINAIANTGGILAEKKTEQKKMAIKRMEILKKRKKENTKHHK